MIKTAVILAAGMGTRLRSIIGEQPKGLLKINQKELILHSIEKLTGYGIKRIVLVTGYREEQYQDLLSAHFPEVTYIKNSDFAVTGSMHSLFLTREVINEGFLLLESDLFYEKRCISSLLDFSADEAILLSGRTDSGDEVYVYGGNGFIKKITKEKLAEPALCGELVGISKISYRLFNQMCDYYHHHITFPSDYHYEDCVSDLSATQRIAYYAVSDLVWTEIDDPSHYQRALETIVPMVEKNDTR